MTILSKKEYERGYKDGKFVLGDAQRKMYQRGWDEGRRALIEEIEEIGRKSEGSFPVGFWNEIRQMNK